MIIAQLSDIHLDDSNDHLARLDAVLAWLKPLRPDALIISGDLAETAHHQNYKTLRKRLDATETPFWIVPGNVDDPAEMRSVFGDRFGWPAGSKLNCSAVIGDEVRVIGLDVTVPGAHHGDAGPVLQWLREQLSSGGPPTLIFQHQHPFQCGIDGKDRNMCQNHAAMAEVIVAAPDRVVGVTCGHVHRPMFARFLDLPATMAPSVAPANRLRLDGKEPTISDPPGLLLHHWRDGRLVSHVVMVR